MLVDSYKQESNYKRKYRLVNVNEGIDLIPFVKNRDMKYGKFEQKKDGSMSANSMSFTLSFPYNTSNVTVNSSSPMLIDAEILKNYMIDLEAFAGLEEPKVTGTISLANLLKKGDNVILFEETENDLLVFDGIAEAPKIKRDKTHIYLNVEVKDRTYSLYELKHLEESFYQNMLLCNTSNKANSLIHQIAYKLGFKDEELDLPNLTTVIPFVLFKKDELIIKELAYAVRLIGGVFTIEKGKLVVRAEANRITETYVFDKRNILSEISIDPVFPNYEKLKVTYDYYFEKDKQDMWILVGENGNLNSANIVIRAGQDRKFLVDWLYNVDLVKEYELYEAVFTLVDGTEIPFPYVLDIDETGGTLTLDNKANNFDVYVKKFKIKGIPLFMQTGNQSYYPANINSKKLLDNLENKFIQNSDLALLFLKANYNENCKFYRSISFSTNVNNYLEPCRKIYLNHVDYTGYVVIEKIDFQGLKMSIQARKYLEPVNIDEIKTLEKSSVDEYEVISNKFLTEKGLYEANLPLAPQNLLLISQALGFTITFDNFSSNLRGHFVYLKKKTDIDWMKFFINTNNYFYQTVEMLTYEVKVSSVSINGVEGETTEVKEVTPIRLHNGVVDYPEGLSPSDLDGKVQNINQNISEITGDIDNIFEINDFHNQKIEIIESDITSMKQKDNDNYTAIQQNATQIQSIAQKTTVNENAITQQGTAITQNANAIESIAQEVETKTTASQVETITNTAIESFSANEFRRTLGTRVSIIDYSKNIDEVGNLNIDSAELEEVMIEDYYSSIYQNARQILALIKNSDEQYSVIQQLANQITLLVQEDSKNYSIIEQLANELSFVVRKDNLVSSINQSAEEIKINAQRIALGNGLVVEDDKVAVKSVFGLNFGLGIGVLGNQDGLILQSNNFRLYANTTTGDFDLLATGNIEFKNAKNRIYLDKENGLSQIILKANWSNNGVMLPEFEGVDFQIGEVGSSKGYFKFDDDEGVSMDIKNLKIRGNSILNTVKAKSAVGMTGVYNGSNYAGKSAFGHNLFNDGWYITCDRRAPNSTVDYFEVFLNLYNVAPTYDINGFVVDEIASKIYAICAVTSGERSSYRIYRSEYQPDSNATLIFQSASYGTSNNISRDVNAIYANNGNIGLYYNIVIFNPDVSKITNELHRYYNGTDTLIHKTVGSNSNNEIKKVLFTLGNRLFFKKNNLLYYTTDNFSTETLFYGDSVGIYNYYLLKNQIYAYKYTPSNILLKLDNNSGAVIESYVLPDQPIDGVANIKDFASNSNYFYIIGYDNFLMTKDFNEYTRVYKDTSDDYVCVLENKTFILKPRTNSSKSDIYRMIGFNFGTLVY